MTTLDTIIRFALDVPDNVPVRSMAITDTRLRLYFGEDAVALTDGEDCIFVYEIAEVVDLPARPKMARGGALELEAAE